MYCSSEGSINSAWGAGLTTCTGIAGNDCGHCCTRAMYVSSAWCAAVNDNLSSCPGAHAALVALMPNQAHLTFSAGWPWCSCCWLSR